MMSSDGIGLQSRFPGLGEDYGGRLVMALQKAQQDKLRFFPQKSLHTLCA